MGIIKKQSFFSTVFIYSGTALGFINAGILMPSILSAEEIGLTSFLNSLTIIFSMIFSLGVPYITINSFPHFRDKNNNNGYLLFLILTIVVGAVLGTSCFLVTQSIWITSQHLLTKYTLLFQVAFIIVFISRLLYSNIDALNRMMYSTTIGVFLESLVVKIIILMALLGVLIVGWTYSTFFIWFMIALSVPGIVSFIYSVLNQKSKNRSLKPFLIKAKPIKKKLKSLAIYGLIGGASSIIVLEIDRVMITQMLDLKSNGIYSTAFYFGLVIGLPIRAISRVVTVVISDAWQEKNINLIEEIYHKSSLNQFIIGGALFLCVWNCYEYVFYFLPKEYLLGKYVVLLIGIAQIIEMVFGPNAEILITSSKYKVNTYLVCVLVLFVVISNYFFIPRFDISGAALSSLFSITIINLIRVIYLFKVFKIQPFKIATFKALLVIISVFLIAAFLIPEFNDPYQGILIEGSIILSCYFILIYLTKTSELVNKYVDIALKYFKMLLKR